MKKLLFIAIFTVVAAPWPASLQAQYFGRNKPRYENKEFNVLQTPHFEIHHYLDNEPLLRKFANDAEHWYLLHQAVLLDTFDQRNPIILYNDHPDFQQTNAISGEISVGTGGVTEGLRNRVVLPLAMSNAQTRHVLGHELVHAFQYHKVIYGDSTSLQSLANLPLWMVEGLAEYLSIGRLDPHTSMWMRDAVLHDRVPTIRKMNDPAYFPYRWGQAFWAFITGFKGDEIVAPLFMSTAKYGFEEASVREIGMKEKELSEFWIKSMKEYYGQWLGDGKERFIGKPLMAEKKNKTQLNIAPVLSPNGQYVLFLSEKDLFTIDFYLANAVNGEIIRKVHSAARSGHLDDLNFIESAGTWAPDSRRFAFVGVSKGDNVLVIKNIEGKTLETLKIPGVPAFSNPAWSPDGRSIVVAGIVNGQVDLYQYFLTSNRVVKLTDDAYSELEPAWSPDGRHLAFASDKLSMDAGVSRLSFNLAVMDMEDESHPITYYDFFLGANNLNPVYDWEGNILFLSDRDGFRNMYKFEPSTGKIFQLTDFLTGISGITPYAPAITASIKENRDRILFTHYFDGGYHIYWARQRDFLNKEVDPQDVHMEAAWLPKVNDVARTIVDLNLSKFDLLAPLPEDSLRTLPYRPRFSLEYIGGSAGVGVATGQIYGGTATGVAGGVDMLFGDMLGNHRLFSSLYLNGEIYDAGLATAFYNLKNRFIWGVGYSHLPYASGRYGYVGIDTLTFIDGTRILTDHFVLDKIRTFEDKISVFGQYPLSRILRVEGGASFAVYYNRVDRFDQYYDAFGRLVYQERHKVEPASVGLNLFKGSLGSVSTAVVGDNSYFGLASPLMGHRFRIGAEHYFGDFNVSNLTVDLRKYFYARPFSLATRFMHYGRYGTNANNFFPLFLGYPWYMRGYRFDKAEEILNANKRSIDELFGSKMAIAGIELRTPFSGPRHMALIPSKVFFTELSLFLDGGLAWDTYSRTNDPTLREFDFNPLFSAGVSMRFNLFGALVLEPYYAWPLLKQTQGVFGVNIVPGW